MGVEEKNRFNGLQGVKLSSVTSTVNKTIS